MDAQTVLVGIAAGFVSLAAVTVSVMQLVNANRKLKFDLYERRLSIYTRVVDYMMHASNPSVGLEFMASHYDILKASAEAKFLFAGAIPKLLETFYSEASFFVAYESKRRQKTLTDGDIVDYEKASQAMLEKLNVLERLMLPYLDFRKVQSFSVWR